MWIALDIPELSMSVQSILRVKNSLLQTRHSDGPAIWEELSRCSSSRLVTGVLNKYIQSKLAEATMPEQRSSEPGGA
ncbi:hypothetical protein LJK88_21180 [Paenibacillus sp. P26]|nr:hypothetical protein LJK88_21180 [Paenibacillus sp. P26]